MNKFSSSDVFQALVTCGGSLLSTATLTGFTSLQSLISHIVRTLAPTSGLITVRLRNVNCGWSLSRSIRLCAA